MNFDSYNLIEFQSEKFLCILYHQTDGLIEKGREENEIAKLLNIYDDGDIQNTEEIVQYLLLNDLIAKGDDKKVRLTEYGLQRCLEVCPPIFDSVDF